jgi:hypothetical protein
MASGLYDSAREEFLGGTLDWDGEDVRAILIDVADYAVNLATHDFLDDVAAAARVAVSGAMGSKTITDGVADAADVVWTSVTGDPCEAIIIYQHTGTESTSALIAYIDGFSVTPNGGNITAVWDSGANRIFKL